MSLQHSPWTHALASQGAGAVSTLMFYPLDVVKTRFMAQDGTVVRQHNGMRYVRVMPALRAIVREEGIGCLFRGAHVAVGASAMSWGAYMLVYRWLERAALHHLSSTGRLDVATVCGAAAGAIVSFLTNPLWLIKARMQLAAPSEEHYCRGLLVSMPYIVQHDGVRSLWRGTSAQILTGIPNSLQYPLYEAIKRALMRRREGSAGNGGGDSKVQRLGTIELAACTVLSKCILACLSHPLQLLKARLMDQRSRVGQVQYATLASALMTTLTREGMAGLYRGLPVGLAHTVPRNVVQFALYEGLLSCSASEAG